MELILLQKVTNLGGLGDKVDVKPGYGRNFLVPQGKAVPATATNIAEFEARRAEYEAKAQSLLSDAEQLTKNGHKVDKSEVVIGEGPFRRTGEYEVIVRLHADVEQPVKVIVVGEAA